MPVGGIRIEDDILITSRGYENLTKAPKGDAMFDIIRGRKSKPKASQPQGTNLSTGATEPPLFRAPGCPLRATPPGLHSIKRAATMPNQTSEGQRAEVDRRSNALHSRRSMTTDERVQHWRQSHQQTSLQKLTTTQDKPNTMCGAFANDLKHILIGDNRCDTSKTRDLPQCTDCAILAQTLGRLRQNLALSKQGSPTQTHAPQDAYSPAHNPTSPRAIHAGLGPQESVSAPSRRSGDQRASAPHQSPLTGFKQTGREIRPTEQERALCQIAPLQDTRPKQSCATVFTAPEALGCQEPESYYRTHEQWQNPIQQSGLKRATPTSQTPALRSHMSMPVRARMAQQQERRRPSNHTDDRDWMS
jgi:Xaa-Pro dipeptidase